MVVEERPTANALPTFPKEDYNDDLTQEDGSAENPFVRSVDENMSGAEVGGAVAATDEAGDPPIYTLGGDTDSFKIDRVSGQIETKVELDYEMQPEHMVTVTATDPSLASTMVYVMIMVKDIDDPAVIAELDSKDYEENDDSPVATFEATDQDGGDITWSLKEDADSDYKMFSISEDEAVLTLQVPAGLRGEGGRGRRVRG